MPRTKLLDIISELERRVEEGAELSEEEREGLIDLAELVARNVGTNDKLTQATIDSAMKPLADRTAELVRRFVAERERLSDAERLRGLHAQYAMAVYPLVAVDFVLRRTQQALELQMQNKDTEDDLKRVLELVDAMRASLSELVAEPALAPLYVWTDAFRRLPGASAVLLAPVLTKNGGPWAYKSPSAYAKFLGAAPRSVYAGYVCRDKKGNVVYSEEPLKDMQCHPRQWDRKLKTNLYLQARLFMKHDAYISNIANTLRGRVKNRHPDFTNAKVEAYLMKDLANLLAQWMYVMANAMLKRTVRNGKIEYIGIPATPYIEALKAKYGDRIYKPAFPLTEEELATMKIYHFGTPAGKGRKVYVNPLTGEIVFTA